MPDLAISWAACDLGITLPLAKCAEPGSSLVSSELVGGLSRAGHGAFSLPVATGVAAARVVAADSPLKCNEADSVDLLVSGPLGGAPERPR